MQKKMRKRTYHNRDMQLRGFLFMILDIFVILSSMIGALWLRFDFSFIQIDEPFWDNVCTYMPVNVICTVLLFVIFHLYTSLWRFAGVEEGKNILFAAALSAAIQTTGMWLFQLSVPRSYPFLYFILLTGLTTVSRFSYRFLRLAYRNATEHKQDAPVRTMIVGAGAAGYILVREMKNSKHLHRTIPCIIDDDPAKQGAYLQGIPIVGGREDIPYFADQYHIQEIVVAIPTLSGAERRNLLDYCQHASCKVLILPGVYQLVNKQVSVSMLRKVDINDLLGRQPVQLEMEEVMGSVRDQTVLVTGGGGSIGSEICRQIARNNPRRLIILDVYENNAYDIQNELLREHPKLNLEVLISSVRDEGRVNHIFETYRPQLVFHAAAHKHVPLMEDSPNEAIKNNVLGTWNVAKAADKYHARKMILISTDKAVRPTNVMGASKRICELIVQSFAEHSETMYSAVRFGNVLGSNGSVVPLFQKQIAEGGPVTVTHPDIIRYFMTIPEAVSLVLQCGALSSGGEVFILDMGEPVRILDMAEKMIRLSGLTPGEDIEITFTGLRPGEKLYEELLLNEKNLKKSEKDRIYVVQQTIVDAEALHTEIVELIRLAYTEVDDIRPFIRKLVPEYTIPVAQEITAQQEQHFKWKRKDSKNHIKLVDNAEYLGVVREIVKSGQQVSITLSGNSMAPFLAHGRDRIMIAPITQPLQRGDMAIFQRRDGRYIMHRICRVRTDKKGHIQYYFAGDAQNMMEGPIQREQIFGVITMVFRKGKWIQKGDFWWDFFSGLWVRAFHFRKLAVRIYRQYDKLKSAIVKE